MTIAKAEPVVFTPFNRCKIIQIQHLQKWPAPFYHLLGLSVFCLTWLLIGLKLKWSSLIGPKLSLTSLGHSYPHQQPWQLWLRKQIIDNFTVQTIFTFSKGGLKINFSLYLLQFSDKILLFHVKKGKKSSPSCKR